MPVYISSSEEETRSIAQDIAKTITSGDVILLRGDLGAGKTTFTKGLTKALGIEENITSPTFALMNIYEVRNEKSEIKNLIHIDTYRLETEQDLIDIGAEDYIGAEGTISVIEWPDKILSLLGNKKTINIMIGHKGNHEREISVSGLNANAINDITSRQ